MCNFKDIQIAVAGTVYSSLIRVTDCSGIAMLEIQYFQPAQLKNSSSNSLLREF